MNGENKVSDHFMNKAERVTFMILIVDHDNYYASHIKKCWKNVIRTDPKCLGYCAQVIAVKLENSVIKVSKVQPAVKDFLVQKVFLAFKFPSILQTHTTFLASIGGKGVLGDIGPQGRQGLDGNKGIKKSSCLFLCR